PMTLFPSLHSHQQMLQSNHLRPNYLNQKQQTPCPTFPESHQSGSPTEFPTLPARKANRSGIHIIRVPAPKSGLVPVVPVERMPPSSTWNIISGAGMSRPSQPSGLVRVI